MLFCSFSRTSWNHFSAKCALSFLLLLCSSLMKYCRNKLLRRFSTKCWKILQQKFGILRIPGSLEIWNQISGIWNWNRSKSEMRDEFSLARPPDPGSRPTSDIFCRSVEFGAVQKCANLDVVELEKCCKTHISSQKSASMQPRTSPPKVGKLFT